MGLLVTLEEVKIYLEINNDEKDAQLGFVLESLSDALEVYLGRYILIKEIIEEPHYIDGPAQKSLQLNFYPATEISKIIFNGYEVSVERAELNAGLIFREDCWYGTSLVTYKAGLAASVDDVPKDIKLALCMWAKEILNRDGFVKSESLGDFSMSYADNNSIPNAVLSLVEKYRRHCL